MADTDWLIPQCAQCKQSDQELIQATAINNLTYKTT